MVITVVNNRRFKKSAIVFVLEQEELDCLSKSQPFIIDPSDYGANIEFPNHIQIVGSYEKDATYLKELEAGELLAHILGQIR